MNLCILCALYVVWLYMAAEMATALGQAFIKGEDCVCRSSFSYFISLYGQNEACRTATPPRRGACRLFCNGQTNTE